MFAVELNLFRSTGHLTLDVHAFLELGCVPLDCGQNAQIEHGRPQRSGNAACGVDGGVDQASGRLNQLQGLGAGQLGVQAVQHDFDSGQGAAQLIMDLACDVAALLLLNGVNVLGQARQFLMRAAGFDVGDPAARDVQDDAVPTSGGVGAPAHFGAQVDPFDLVHFGDVDASGPVPVYLRQKGRLAALQEQRHVFWHHSAADGIGVLHQQFGRCVEQVAGALADGDEGRRTVGFELHFEHHARHVGDRSLEAGQCFLESEPVLARLGLHHRRRLPLARWRGHHQVAMQLLQGLRQSGSAIHAPQGRREAVALQFLVNQLGDAIRVFEQQDLHLLLLSLFGMRTL